MTLHPIDFLTRVWQLQNCPDGGVFYVSVKDWASDADGDSNWDDYPIFDLGQLGFEIPTNRDLYFCFNSFSRPRRLRKYACASRWLYADLDEVDPQLDPAPTIAWETSPGRYQAAWLLDRPVGRRRFEALNQKLTYFTGADKGGWSSTKVLRVPGSVSTKYGADDPHRVRLLFSRSLVHRVEDLERLLQDVATPATASSAPALDAASLPAYRTVYRRHRRKIAPKDRMLLAASATARSDDRSATLWRLENNLLAAGVPPKHVYVLVQQSTFNKYKGQRREQRMLWSEINKAAAVIEERATADERVEEDESTVTTNRAVSERSTDPRKRAGNLESTEEGKRVVRLESTEEPERALRAKSTARSKRAGHDESTALKKRALRQRSTERAKRAALDESTESTKRATEPESSVTNERAVERESTRRRKRADRVESTERSKRAVRPKSTATGKRADDRKSTDSSERPRRIKFVKFSDFLTTQLARPTWLVEGIWGDGAHGLLAGEAKTFKSLFTLDLSVSIASGTPFLGHFKVPKTGPVLIAQEENEPGLVWDRLWRISHARGLAPGSTTNGTGVVDFVGADLPIHLANNQGLDLTAPADIRSLARRIERHRPVLVVLDPLYLMTPGLDENSAQDMTPVLRRLLAIKQKYGCGILLVHHFHKPKAEKSGRRAHRLSGTGVFHRWYSSAVYVDAIDDSGTVRISSQHRGHGNPQAFDVRFDLGGDDDDMTYSVGLQPADEHAPSHPSASRDPGEAIVDLERESDLMQVMRKATSDWLSLDTLAAELKVTTNTARKRAKRAGLTTEIKSINGRRCSAVRVPEFEEE